MRLHAMGFAGSSSGTAKFIAEHAAKATRSVSCAMGEYRVWHSTGGAELWFHYPLRSTGAATGSDVAGDEMRATHALGVTPFHRGESDVRIRVERARIADRLNPLEGNIKASLRMPDAPGPHPQLRLEMVPFALQRRSRRPFIAQAQIVGFAYDVRAFGTVDDYLAGTSVMRLIAPGAIAPVTAAEVPELKLCSHCSDFALGLITGLIERSQRLVNPLSGAPYYWLVLATDAGRIDIVTAPDSVDGDISEGHIAQVCASFVGRLRDTPIK